MTQAAAQSRQQARQWSAACGISAFINVATVLLIVVWMSFSVILDVIAYVALSALGFSPAPFGGNGGSAPPPPAVEESIATIIPDTTVASEPALDTPFVRTSPDQQAQRPEAPAFTGERNTQATSDAPPVAGADPLMPSQRGKEPDYEGELETTVSNYQDGELEANKIAPPDPTPGPPEQKEAVAIEGAEAITPAPPAATAPPIPETPMAAAAVAPKDPIAAGPYQVERQTQQASPPEQPKPAPPDRQTAAEGTEAGKAESAKQEPKPAVKSDTPGFTGYQRKTRIQGSITRQGRSALDVEDSALGRYHAALSRAVEKEWQLNCVRNRDYLLPGQLIVRFVLEPSGKVRSLVFVEEVEGGGIQKGFTLESIRTAKIPPFPAELKKQLDGEPLEVTYSFTF